MFAGQAADCEQNNGVDAALFPRGFVALLAVVSGVGGHGVDALAPHGFVECGVDLPRVEARSSAARF